MLTLINRQLLKLVYIDEIHLFVMFGITFRKEFTALRHTLFCHLLSNINPRYTYASGLCSDLKVPMLLMTATFNSTMLNILQRMIGIRVLPCNYLWIGRAMMARRHIRINISMNFFAMKIVKQVIQTTLFGNLNKKVIVYTNTTASLELLRSETESWMDFSDEIMGDALVIQGDLQPEVKFVSAEQFTRVVDDPQQLINTNQFYPEYY